MNDQWNRREILKQLAAASAALMLPAGATAKPFERLAGQDGIEIQIASISERTLRLSIFPARNSDASSIPFNGALVRTAWDAPVAKLHIGSQAQTITIGNLALKFFPGNDLSGVGEEYCEQLKRLALELDADSEFPQFTGPKVRFEYAKSDFSYVGRDLLNHGERQLYHNEEHGLTGNVENSHPVVTRQ